MRSIWKGLISFGLVNIPVALYPAAEDKELHFNQLHEEDGGRIGYNKVCKTCGQTVDGSQIIKGYQFEKGKYVHLTDEELEQAARKSTRTVEIKEFVDQSSVDPIYFEKAYYLGPEENAKTAYALLVEALKRSGKVAVAKMVMHDKEYLALIRPSDSTLVLNTMHFPDEVRKPQGIGIPAGDTKLGDKELEMADMLVDKMSATFVPEDFQDTYRQELLDMIHKKAEGEQFEAAPEAPQPTNVIDILSQLKASVEQAEQEKLQKVS